MSLIDESCPVRNIYDAILKLYIMDALEASECVELLHTRSRGLLVAELVD